MGRYGVAMGVCAASQLDCPLAMECIREGDSLWVPMGLYVSLWVSVGPYGSLWIPMDSSGAL